MPRDVIPETTSPVVELLRQGRERIAEAWVQRRPVRRLAQGRYAFCMFGSINELVDTPRSVSYEAEMMLMQAVNLLAPACRTVTIVEFNDDWYRQQHDVVQAFDVAIELQIRKEQQR